ncbi:MAG: hypothetical protein N3A01_08025 [Bacteroidales bacterium]|nr:hypothetical protein [Bacteroidales bacterium]
MKTNNITFEELLRKKFADAEISPPENIWHNVEKSIPQYIYYINYKAFILNTIVILMGIGIISLTVVYSNKQKIMKHDYVLQIAQPQNSFSFPTIAQVNKNFKSKSELIIHNNQKILVRTNINERKQEQSVIPEEQNKEEKIIYIEANKYKDLITIEIFDDTYKLIKKIENPVANEYGYYEIKLNKNQINKVILKLYTNDGKVIVNSMNL